MSNRLVFLKLGGSLITVKDQPHTPRLEALERLAHEIAQALAEDSGLRILIGHGSGSFGHVVASQYRTRQGVKSAEDWQGFAEVWRQAAGLNHLVMSALHKAGLPAVVFPPSARVITRSGQVDTWDVDPLRNAMAKSLLPVVYGDVVFDQVLGGTILSTEDLFSYLALQLNPSCLLFAGLEPGVWANYPDHSSLVDRITPANFSQVEKSLKGSIAIDVTGGMLDKVRQVIALLNELPDLQGMIFSGETPGNIRRALLGESLGTIIHGD